MRYVFLAGIDNSGPSHWQSLWRQQLEGSIWVEHADWRRPDRDAWVADLDAALSCIEGPKFVVAHSLGCLLLAEWLRDHADAGIAGAFLVAVPDVAAPAFPAAAKGFRSAFELSLPCPALLVASENDAYASIDYARRLATHWHTGLIEAGPLGHINADSRLGEWQRGRRWLDAFEVSLTSVR